MTLTELLEGLWPPALYHHLGAQPVGDLYLDSRQLDQGGVFVCLGEAQHAQSALQHGASLVLSDKPLPPLAIPVLVLPGLSLQLQVLAKRRYPQLPDIIGVTGTNGKSTLVALIAQFLTAAGVSVATVGTLGAAVWGQPLVSTGMTTPDILTNYRLLAQFAERGIQQVAMEVSSHALAQGRVAGLPIRVAVFTNLTQDHLDYHGTLEAYGACKARLFAFDTLHHQVVNADDAWGQRLPCLPGVVRWHYSLQQPGSTFYAEELVANTQGMAFDLQYAGSVTPCQSPLFGAFNVANVLAAMGAALAVGVPWSRLLTVINRLKPVAGRLEALEVVDGVRTFVDFAHTPDGLEQTLKALRHHTPGRLWVVFGCGGDRDRQKRPLMGAVAEAFADEIVLTSDNPRSENPVEIIREIAAGCQGPVHCFQDREAAIAFAIGKALPGDSILLAGKGHETHQWVGDQALPFSDVAVAKRLWQDRVRLSSSTDVG
jgi:UDP-N-acetylmuramoyl-L-alanyl-D-glutamate--2,6-diaminopimelate ligase